MAGERDPKMYFLKLAELIEKDIEMYELLMRAGKSSFVAKATVVLNRWVQGILDKNDVLDAEKVTTATEYVAAGIFSAYRGWFHSDRRKPLKDFSLELCQLVMYGLPAYLM